MRTKSVEILPEKVCLIIPPSIFLLDDRVFMSLGILKVAAVLEEAGISVDVLDLCGVKNFEDVIRDYFKTVKEVPYIGLTATTPQLPAVKQIQSLIRTLSPETKLILGGPHITLVNAAYKRELRNYTAGRATTAMNQAIKMFDVLVCGDGEEAVFVALQKNSPSIVDADDRKSPFFLNNERLTRKPFPARKLVDVESYRYSIDGFRALSLIAQLGCPFNCGFCGGRESPMLRNIRTRTSENIVAEMVHLYMTYKVCGFMLYDDELNVNKKMVELMNLIAETQRTLKVEWRLRGFIKSQLFTNEQAEAMYRAGFRWILVGFESGSPAILEAINKMATREENTRCMEIAKRNNLKVKALMSIGHPGETRETILDTKEWLLETKPDDFDVTIITCYPGTPYYDLAVPVPGKEGIWVYTYPKQGTKLYQVEIDYTTTADYYKGDPNGGYISYVFTEGVTREELVHLRDEVEHDVRKELGIPFNPGAPSMLYEHSMGQQGLPSNLLRTSSGNKE
jgi:anaerobic magnesium-protoporphyrin IX monomethyl ester cyclase